MRYTAVSSFIFLRFFAPAILSPNLFQLTPHHPVSIVPFFFELCIWFCHHRLSGKILSSILLIASRRNSFVSSKICYVCLAYGEWLYVKNLGGVGGTVNFKVKQGRWSCFYCLTLMLDWLSATIGDVLDVKQLIQNFR